MKNAMKNWLQKKAQCEEGTATVEAVLWLPFFMALFTLIVDTSVVFHNHNGILRAVQDANRAYSIGRYESDTETENMIEASLSHVSGNISASTQVINGVIQTTVQVSAGDLDLIGLFTGIANATLTINAQHLMEA